MPASDPSGKAGVETSLLLVSFVPCLHYRILFGCVVGSIGALSGVGIHVDTPRPDSTVYGATGGRLGVEARIVRFFAIRAYLDILGTLTRTSLRINDQVSWTTPPVSGSLGLALAGLF